MKTLSLHKIPGISAAFVKIGRYVNIVAPTFLFLAALAIWFAFSQISNAISTGAKTAANTITQSQTPTINIHNIEKIGYDEVSRIISLNNPAVNVEVGDNNASLEVYIYDPEKMPEWIFLLSTLQSYRTGLIWNADIICLMKCVDNRAAMAVLRASTQDIVIK